MKRILILLLAIFLIATLLAGCGDPIEITLGSANSQTPGGADSPNNGGPGGTVIDVGGEDEPGGESEAEQEVDNRTMEEKYADACAANDDCRGWIRIDNSYVDHAVLQTTDNTFYLDKGLQKSYYYYGSVFANYQNNLASADALDQNTVLFGHNKNDGILFGGLVNYSDLGWAQNHPFVRMIVNGVETKWQVFAALDCELGFSYITTALGDGAISEARDRSYIDVDASVSSADKILTLSTCTYKYTYPSGKYREDVRFVVMAKLVDDGAAAASVSANGDRITPSF